MNGLELARYYYETAGKQALERQVPDLVPRLAIGLAGEGSECFGLDDELSRDHDWGPAFCIWMTEEDFVKHGVQVQAVYRGLPDAVAGFSVRKSGIMSSGAWAAYASRTGIAGIPDMHTGRETLAQWRQIPESFLATATKRRNLCRSARCLYEHSTKAACVLSGGYSHQENCGACGNHGAGGTV